MFAKKEGTVIFITNLQRVNMNIVWKHYRIQRIGDTMHQFESFQFATMLYLNIAYYTIWIDTKSKNITTIVT